MTDHKQLTLALDVMGTDAGPGLIVSGGVEAAREFGPKWPVQLIMPACC